MRGGEYVGRRRAQALRVTHIAGLGVEEISGNYEAHCRAAREIAEEYFDSDKVLSKLLADLGVG